MQEVEADADGTNRSLHFTFKEVMSDEKDRRERIAHLSESMKNRR